MYDWINVQGSLSKEVTLQVFLFVQNLSNICGASLHCIADACFVSYMESVYAYVCQKTKLDPNQGVELSADGVVIEVEKLQQQEKNAVDLQVQKSQQMAEQLKSDIDDDKSADWMPTKGFSRVSC